MPSGIRKLFTTGLPTIRLLAGHIADASSSMRKFRCSKRRRMKAAHQLRILACWVVSAAFISSQAAAAVLWSTLTGGAVDSSPTVVNGIVYVGSDDGSVYAMNATTGQIVWKTDTGAAVDSSPTLVSGTIYVGADNGLYAIAASTGQILWKTTVAAFNSSPTVVNGVVYVGGTDGFYAVDANTGAVIWKTNTFPTTGLAYNSSPTVVNGQVYVGADNGLYSIEAATGKITWVLIGGPFDSSPTNCRERRDLCRWQ